MIAELCCKVQQSTINSVALDIIKDIQHVLGMSRGDLHQLIVGVLLMQTQKLQKDQIKIALDHLLPVRCISVIFDQQLFEQPGNLRIVACPEDEVMVVGRGASGGKHMDHEIREQVLTARLVKKAVPEKFIGHVQIYYDVTWTKGQFTAHHIQVKDADIAFV